MRDVEDQISDGLVPVYRMTNFFLNDIVQASLMTSMPSEYLTSPQAFADSWPDHWDEWLIHYIGFLVCAAIGIVGFFTMILVAMIFPCCRCCGRCGAKDPEHRKQKRKSRCCIRACEISMAIVTISLLLANLPLYAVNEKFYPQLKTDFFKEVSSSLGMIDGFMKKIPGEMSAAVYDSFIELEDSLFQTLDNIPADSMTAIDDATGVVTSLEELSTFTGNLPALDTTMSDAIQLAVALDQNTATLWTDYTAINSSMATKLTGCSSESCQNLVGLMASVRIAVNFTVVDETLTPKQQIIDLAIQNGLIDLVNNSTSQLDEINKLITDSTADTTEQIKVQCILADRQIEAALIDLNETVGSLDIATIQEEIISFQNYVELPADIVYYCILGLSIVMSLIVALNIVGLLLGILLPPSRPQPSATGSTRRKCCSRDKSLASHFLMFSVALTFIFYWFYLLIVSILFVTGGLAETEACRHVINYDNKRSAEVLAIFDNWANESLYESTGIDVLPFNIYGQCAGDVTVYQALNLAQKWNLSEVTDSEELDKAIEDLKAIKIVLPQVNFTNDNLNRMLFDLENALNPTALNTTRLIEYVSGPITVPDLRVIRDAASTVTGGVDLSPEVGALRDLIDADLSRIESYRDVLIDQLTKVRVYIGNINFTATALTLDFAQQELNANGDEIVGKFVNDTADEIYLDVTQYTENTVDAVENDIAQCLPIYDSVTTIIDATCVAMIYPINGFWFCLGWGLAFLIPSLVLAVQLATVYRYTRAANSVCHSDDAQAPSDAEDDVIIHCVTVEENHGLEHDVKSDEPPLATPIDNQEKSTTDLHKMNESTSIPPPDYNM